MEDMRSCPAMVMQTLALQALQAQWGNLQQGGWLRAFPPMPLGLAPGGPLQMPPRGPLQGMCLAAVADATSHGQLLFTPLPAGVRSMQQHPGLEHPVLTTNQAPTDPKL